MESEATVVLFLLDKVDNIFPKKYIPFKDVKSKITIAKQLPLDYSIVWGYCRAECTHRIGTRGLAV